MTEYCMIKTTCPTKETAKLLADLLLNARLAACVQIIQDVQSIYIWEGKITNDMECILFIKSTTTKFAAIQELILNNHPYECPEILLFPVNNGNNAYLEWITHSTSY